MVVSRTEDPLQDTAWAKAARLYSRPPTPPAQLGWPGIAVFQQAEHSGYCATDGPDAGDVVEPAFDIACSCRDCQVSGGDKELPALSTASFNLHNENLSVPSG